MSGKKNKAERENHKVYFFDNSLLVKYLIGIISLLFVIVLVYKGRLEVQPVLSAGEITNQSIMAQIDFSYIDNKETEELKEKRAGEVPFLYYIDSRAEETAKNRIEKLFLSIANKEEAESIKEKIDWPVSDMTIKTLSRMQNLSEYKDTILKVCSELLGKGIITSSSRIKIISSGRDDIYMLDIATKNINKINIDKLIIEDEIDSVIENRIKNIYPFDRPLRNAVKDILINMVKPNLFYDEAEVKRRKEIAMESVGPVYKTIKKGQTIIRQGDPVNEAHIAMLEAQAAELNKQVKGLSHLWKLFGTILFAGILFFILVTYLHYHQPEIFSCNKRLLLLSIIVISAFGLTKILTYIPVNIYKPFWQYFMIIPIAAMLIAIIMDKELAIIASFIMSVLATVITKQSLPYTVIIIFGSIIAIQTTKRLLHRWEFIMAGIFVGIAQISAIVMVNLLKPYSLDVFSWKAVGYELLGGFSSGIACTVFAGICLPVIERVFDITTDIRLLELSDLNHPLLKTMITEAPGTYHHSIIVSNMAEDAAGSIGANPLLARVGGYFHDIGKTTKPEYFIENAWFEEESKHERLLPTMSNLVITAHVKDGEKSAQKYKLPKAVTDIIKEHHGNSLVYYFYKQAEKASIKSGAGISEMDFRYPGPKPQSKESGIILLADAIEAASHTLVKPTPNKIGDLVNEISKEKINDGQLDECGLTLKDINIIRERFENILTGILHKRVEYPDKAANEPRNSFSGSRNID